MTKDPPPVRGGFITFVGMSEEKKPRKRDTSSRKNIKFPTEKPTYHVMTDFTWEELVNIRKMLRRTDLLIIAKKLRVSDKHIIECLNGRYNSRKAYGIVETAAYIAKGRYERNKKIIDTFYYLKDDLAQDIQDRLDKLVNELNEAFFHPDEMKLYQQIVSPYSGKKALYFTYKGKATKFEKNGRCKWDQQLNVRGKLPKKPKDTKADLTQHPDAAVEKDTEGFIDYPT